MAQGNPIQVNIDVQRLADAITNRNDLFMLIPTRYEGDPRRFREWVKQIEKYAFMTELQADKVKLVAYKTSAGPVSDFIERYITNSPNNTWNQLKSELTMRFAEISDSDQALKMLREIKQKKDENVQCYAERLLSLATEAYSDQQGGVRAADRSLVGYFTDGLYFDYLQFKLLREKPATLQEAIRICINEQNLRKLFKTKTGRDFSRARSNDSQEEPMEVDQLRPTRKCQLCFKKGHTARYCRMGRGQAVNAVNADRDRRKNNDRRCYFCGKTGHIKRFCFEFQKQNESMGQNLSNQSGAALNEQVPRM